MLYELADALQGHRRNQVFSVLAASATSSVRGASLLLPLAEWRPHIYSKCLTKVMKTFSCRYQQEEKQQTARVALLLLLKLVAAATLLFTSSECENTWR